MGGDLNKIILLYISLISVVLGSIAAVSLKSNVLLRAAILFKSADIAYLSSCFADD